MTPDDLRELADLLPELQRRMHPVYAPFVAVTAWGLRRLARKADKS